MSRVIRRLSFIAARRADVLICKSDGLRSALPRAHDRARALVIPNGVDVAQFCPGDRLAARRRLGFDPEERLVLFPSTPTDGSLAGDFRMWWMTLNGEIDAELDRLGIKWQRPEERVLRAV